MEDSFEARLAGQAPVQEKKKSGKGWKICSIVTLVLLIGVGVFAGILFFNKDDSKVANLQKKIDEKDAKIAELEEKQEAEPTETKCDTPDTPDTPVSNTTTQTGVIDVDINELKSAAKKADGLKDFTDIVFKMSESKKYIIAGGQAVEYAEAGGFYLYMYKENKAGASWNKLYGTQAGISCSALNQTQKDVFHGVENCLDDEGNYQAI